MATDPNPSNSNLVLIAATSNSNLESDPSMDFIVFCDTNLGFKLAMSVQYNDTVRDLKRNIMTEHAATFQDIGETNVLAIKAGIRGAFYHLPDSMLVRKVFEGDIGKRFLQIDAAPKVDRVADVINCRLLEAKSSSFDVGQTTNDAVVEKEVSESQIERKMEENVVQGKGYIGNEKDFNEVIEQGTESRRMKNREPKLGLQIGNQADPCPIEKKRFKKRKQKSSADRFMENLRMEEAQSDINQPDLAQIGEKIIKEQGNLRDARCENDADGSIEKDTNSQREKDSECPPDLPADNNEDEFFSHENKRYKKTKEKISVEGCITKQKIREAKCDVNQPDSGEVALERNSDNKEEENMLGSVCNLDACKNDFDLLQPDLTKERKRKKKSSKHIYETVNMLDSETGSDVRSLSKIGVVLEAINQVDEENARKSLSNKNGDHEFPMEKSTMPEHPLPQCSPATTENAFAAVDKVIEEICRQSSIYTVEAPLGKVDATFVTDEELNSNADFNKESNGEVGRQEVTDSDIPTEVFTEICPVKDIRVSQHNRKKTVAKPSSKNKLCDHSTTFADLGAATAAGNVKEAPNGYDDLCKQGNLGIFQDITDPVDHELSTETRTKVRLAKDKGSHRSRKKAAKVDSSYQRLSNNRTINADSNNIYVSEIPTDAQTFQSSRVCELKVPTADDGNPSQVSENVEQHMAVGESHDKEVSEVSMPKVASPSNHVEDLKAVDHVEGPTSAAEGVNFADFFCPQVDKQEIVVSADEGRAVKTETKRMKKQKLKRKRDKKISDVHMQDSSTIVASIGEPPAEDAETKERRRKLVYDGDMQNCNPSMQDRSNHSDNSQCSRDLSDTPKYHLTSKLSDSNMASKGKETDRMGVLTRKSHASKGSKKEQVSDTFSDTEPEMVMQKNEQDKISQYIKGMTSTPYDNAVENMTSKDKASRSNNNREPHSNAAGACVKEMTLSKCASIGNIENNTNDKAGSYRITVRKVPGRDLKKLDNFSQDRTLLSGADTIFNHIDNALEGENHKGNGKTASKRSCATSFRSADRDGKLDVAKTVNGHGNQDSMSFPGWHREDRLRRFREFDQTDQRAQRRRCHMPDSSRGATASAAYSGKSKENHRNVTTTSGSDLAKSKLAMILRNSSSYKKAKLALSQSQTEEESQSVDVVMETQPEVD